MKRSTAAIIGRAVMVLSLVIIALGVFSAFRHNLAISDLEDKVSAQQQGTSEEKVKIIKILKLLSTSLLSLCVSTRTLSQERINRKPGKMRCRAFSNRSR